MSRVGKGKMVSSGCNSESSDASNATYDSTICYKPCGHDIEADLLVSYSVLNPERRYYRCKFRHYDDCKFFEWLDPDLPQNLKNMMSRVIIKKQSAESEVEWMKQKQKIFDDRARSAEAKLKEAERSLSQLRCTVEELSDVNLKIAGRLDYMEHDNVVIRFEKLKLQRSLGKYKLISKLLVGLVLLLFLVLITCCRYANGVGQKHFMLP